VRGSARRVPRWLAKQKTVIGRVWAYVRDDAIFAIEREINGATVAQRQ
jgi:hypothetical protein